MIDLRSVSVHGALNYGRARVLWRDGQLKVYTKNGLMCTMWSSRPEKKKGWTRAWTALTERGEVMFRGKCMTCGGRSWLRIIMKSGEELWEAVV